MCLIRVLMGSGRIHLGQIYIPKMRHAAKIRIIHKIVLMVSPPLNFMGRKATIILRMTEIPQPEIPPIRGPYFLMKVILWGGG